MKIGRIAAVTAAVAVGGMVLAGCAGPSDDIQAGTTVYVGQNQPFTAVNNAAHAGEEYTTYNGNVDYMTSGAFYWYDNTPKLVLNTKFGSIEKVSDNPLTVKYTIADGVKWSDGVPVDATDLLLNWVSVWGKYNDDGSGAVTPTTGVNFTSISTGALDAVQSKIPEVSSDGKSITVTYDNPYVDWQLAMSGAGLPAHIVAEEAGVVTGDDKDGKAGKKAVLDAIQNGDNATLAKLASAWADDWVFENKTSADITDPKLYVSDGPYILSSFDANQATVKANPAYVAGPKPKVDTITFKFIADPTAQAQALANGEISLFYGQPTADTVTTLKSTPGVHVETDGAGSYEHIDLTFDNGGPFDPATYGGDAAKALAVRQAFLKTVPRADIVDQLIKPIDANAKILESNVSLPGTALYDAATAGNGASAYDKVDIDGAKALLTQAGVTTPITVKVNFADTNPRRASEFQLMQASAAKAGFDLETINSGSKWGSALGNGTYDVTFFAFSYTALPVLQSESTFKSKLGNNYQGLSDPKIDALFSQLETEFDPAKQQDILVQVDKLVVDDAATLPLFQFPDVTAWSDSLKGVSYSSISPNVFWNPWDWTSTITSSSSPTPAS